MFGKKIILGINIKFWVSVNNNNNYYNIINKYILLYIFVYYNINLDSDIN